MGNRTSDILKFMLIIATVLSLISVGFAVFSISKSDVYNHVDELVYQLGDVTQVVYADLDQQRITGFKLKEVVSQSVTSDCAIIVSSLGFLGAQAGLGAKVGNVVEDGETAIPETSLNGDISMAMMDKATPIVQLENMPLRTGSGTLISYPLAVNFGSVLKNSIVEAPNDNGDIVSVVYSTDGTADNIKFSPTSVISGEEVAEGSTFTKFSGTSEYAQTINYDNGEFTTKLDFATDPTSRIVRYDRTSDFTKLAQTYTISDDYKYNSYLLKNTAGDYMGIVFCQSDLDTAIGLNKGSSGVLEDENISYLDFVLTSTNHQKAGIDDFSGDVVIPSTFEDNGVHYKVVGIANSTFSDSIMLNSVVIPDTVTQIGSFAFKGCTNLTSVVMSKNVSAIEKYTFKDCKNLKTISTLGNKIIEIGDYAFNGCNNLESDILIPSTCKKIGSSAFNGCEKINSLTLSNGIEEIGSVAFNDCKSIKSLVIPDSLITMGFSAFDTCSSLESVVIGKGLKEIPTQAFFSCTSLKSIKLGENVESLGKYSFYGCSSLESFTINANMKNMDSLVFHVCPNLTHVIFENPNGWYVGSSSGSMDSAVSNVDLSSPSKAAQYLTSNYLSNYWTKSN